ncbi:MAG: LytR C-terminal domain-containing protein [Acidimicrobiales bacterium]
MNVTGRRRPGDNVLPGGGTAAMRGALLIAFAVVLGVGLLANSFDDEPRSTASPDDGGQTDGTGSGNGDDGNDTTETSEPETASTHPTAEVTAFALNGSGGTLQGVAGQTTDRLVALGYNTVPGDNTDPVTASVIYYLAGYEGDALEVASALGIAETAVLAMPTPPPVPGGDLKGAQIVVVIGPDYQPPTADATSTSVTATGN